MGSAFVALDPCKIENACLEVSDKIHFIYLSSFWSGHRAEIEAVFVYHSESRSNSPRDIDLDLVPPRPGHPEVAQARPHRPRKHRRPDRCGPGKGRRDPQGSALRLRRDGPRGRPLLPQQSPAHFRAEQERAAEVGPHRCLQSEEEQSLQGASPSEIHSDDKGDVWKSPYPQYMKYLVLDSS